MDIIIVGAGIAGASAALSLSRHSRVMLIEANEPAAGASGVAGGLFSPMLALRGRPIWRMKEAIDAFHEQLEDAAAHHLFDDRGVVRPAHNEQQAEYFVQSVERCPEEAVWMPPCESQERYPFIHAPFGSMYTKRGGATNLTDYVNHLVAAAVDRGVEIQTQTRVIRWGEENGKAYVDVTPNSTSHTRPERPHQPRVVRRIRAHRVILSFGKYIFSAPSLAGLSLHAVKGQTIRVAPPGHITYADIPPVSGKGYVIPQPDHFAVGSSFEHTFEHENPTDTISEELLQKAQYMVPGLKEAQLIDAQAGIRVSVPGVRLPVVGKAPGHDDVWLFTAFGSKGLLLSPLLSKNLTEYLQAPSSIPSSLRPRVKSS